MLETLVDFCKCVLTTLTNINKKKNIQTKKTARLIPRLSECLATIYKLMNLYSEWFYY